MKKEGSKALRLARQDDVRGVVITGAGEKAFAAGADIGEFAGMESLDAHRFAARGQAVFSSIESTPKPVVAAVNGFALGGGCELAMACHLRVAAETAQFGQPEVQLGLIAGYYRGWVDQVISRVVDVWMSFPAVLFAILLIAVIGTGLTSVIVAIIVIDWTRFCRVVRAETMAQARMDYVDSARIAGFSRAQTLWREVFPNVLPVIIAVLTLEMGIAIVVEAILSFVNLSISTDDPTWGGMIAEGRLSIHQAWWVLVFPMITLFLTVLSFTQLGEALRMRFDPVLR